VLAASVILAALNRRFVEPSRDRVRSFYEQYTPAASTAVLTESAEIAG
jgi:hypothetical protein